MIMQTNSSRGTEVWHVQWSRILMS